MATRPKRKASRAAARRRVDPRILAAAIGSARVADSRRGEDILILHIEELIIVTDYFVMVSAKNKRQIQAIAADIKEYFRGAGFTGIRMEGYEEASWVLIDCGPIVVHIFRQDLRSYYDLELLWGDAPSVEWRETPSKK
jgi:ribosome-associated protein